jgi:ankyrin repeat protein
VLAAKGVEIVGPATSSLAWAANAGDLQAVGRLLQGKADVNSRDGIGSSALSWAATGGHLVVVRALLEARAEVNNKDAKGKMALAWAATTGDVAVVKVLLECKARTILLWGVFFRVFFWVSFCW